MKVPTLVTNRTKPSSQPLIGPSGAGGTPEAFGSNIGRSMAQLGANVAALGAKLEEQAQSQERFDALRRLTEFGSRVERGLTEAQRAASTNPIGFADTIQQTYSEMEREFLENEVPAWLREEFSVRTGELGTRVAAQAYNFQLGQTDQFFRTGIEDAFNKARVELSQNGTLEDLDLQRAMLDEIIDSTGLSNEEKEAIRRKAHAGLETVIYRSEQIRLLTADAAGSSEGPARSQALSLMAIITGASPDEMTARAEQGEQLAVASLGSLDAWAALPSNVRASLIVAAADYNGLPEDVVAAVRSGNLDAIAASLRDLPTPGADEIADLVHTPSSVLDDDPRFDNVPYEDRVALRQDAEREVASILTQLDRAENARNAELVNALHTALFDGTAGQKEIDDAREAGWLVKIEDIEKAARLLEDRDNDLRLTQYANERLAANIPFNPNSEDDKKALNALLGKEGQQALLNLDNEYVSNSLVPLVRTGQDIPTDAVGILVGMMRSNDNTRAKWAIDALTQLQQASPRAFSHRLDEADEKTVDFWNARKNMYDEATLMDMIRGGNTPEQRRITDMLRKEGEALWGNKDVGPALVQHAISSFGVGGWFGPNLSAVPWVARSFTADFQTRFIDAYSQYGDVNEARDAAIKSMRRDWAVSDIGGTATLMKWAPSNVGYLPIDGSYKWIEDQVLSELGFYIDRGIGLGPDLVYRQLVLDEAKKAGFTPIQSFQLVSDEQTRAEYAEASRGEGEPPSYMISVKHADGTDEVLMENIGTEEFPRMVPLRMFFEVTPELEAKQIEEFMRKRERVLATENAKGYMGAIRHSLETGVPLPPDLFDESESTGIRSVLMGEGDDAVP